PRGAPERTARFRHPSRRFATMAAAAAAAVALVAGGSVLHQPPSHRPQATADGARERHTNPLGRCSGGAGGPGGGGGGSAEGGLHAFPLAGSVYLSQDLSTLYSPLGHGALARSGWCSASFSAHAFMQSDGVALVRLMSRADAARTEHGTCPHGSGRRFV